MVAVDKNVSTKCVLMESLQSVDNSQALFFYLGVPLFSRSQSTANVCDWLSMSENR